MIAFQFAERAVTWNDIALYALRHADIRFAQQARRAFIIGAECQRRGITASPEELQKAADYLRQRQSLFSAKKTHLWLEENKLTIEAFEELVEEIVLRDKLMKALAAGQSEGFFRKNSAQLGFVDLSLLSVSDEGIAKELFATLSRREVSFEELVRRYSIDRGTAMQDGELGEVCAIDLHDDVRAALKKAQPGALIGPLLAQAWQIFRVNQVHEAKLDDRTTGVINRLIFEEWIAKEEERSPLTFPTAYSASRA